MCAAVTQRVRSKPVKNGEVETGTFLASLITAVRLRFRPSLAELDRLRMIQRQMHVAAMPVLRSSANDYHYALGFTIHEIGDPTLDRMRRFG
jgi:hypothetical protein